MTSFFTFDPFILRALVAGAGVAAAAGAVGCFVVWRRMAYFGDSLAHSALLGVALGLLTGIGTTLSTFLVCAAFAVILAWLGRQKVLATDTMLGILAHAALSLGMVAISFARQRVDLHSYLFGDILTVSGDEVIWIYAAAAVALALVYYNWPRLVLMTISEDLARAEGVKTFRLQLLFMFLITLVVAVSARVSGILLITSMLIIPAASARLIARTPEGMAILSSLLGVAAVGIGMYASIWLDTPSSPTIISASVFLFLALLPVALRKGRAI